MLICWYKQRWWWDIHSYSLIYFLELKTPIKHCFKNVVEHTGLWSKEPGWKTWTCSVSCTKEHLWFCTSHLLSTCFLSYKFLLESQRWQIRAAKVKKKLCKQQGTLQVKMSLLLPPTCYLKTFVFLPCKDIIGIKALDITFSWLLSFCMEALVCSHSRKVLQRP